MGEILSFYCLATAKKKKLIETKERAGNDNGSHQTITYNFHFDEALHLYHSGFFFISLQAKKKNEVFL